MGEAHPEGAEAAEAELRAVRPAVDPVGMEATRARAELALFGRAEPATVGRYVLLGPIAGGGMGMVYGAYDPELDRKVALKVLHPRQLGDSRAHQRLIGEARALAKLDHPNVVRVHDVVTHDGQVVIVMELVQGQTLAAWEREGARSWRDVVALYAHAGEGLAAAHGVGVVHRDFKPANVIVGEDRRVRVLDFGLARFTGGSGDAELAPRGSASAGEVACDRSGTRLTETGDVVGTLGYTAPEQLAGEPATPASDQFSFLVSLHRAIEGVPPFAGTDAGALSASIRAGKPALANDGRRVPQWLRALIARGLSAAPRDRHGSMQELLAVLRRPRGWRRWRTVGLAGAFVLATALAVSVLPADRDQLEVCDGGGAELATIWGPKRRDQIRTILAGIGTPYARQIRDRVLDDLDEYSSGWTQLHRDACLAHRRGDQSAALLDRRMLCMQRRLGDLGAAIDVLVQTDRASIAKAMDVVAKMPPVSECADLERLQAEIDPPETAALRGRVEALRARVSTAAALDRAGRTEQALTSATEAIAEAQRTGYLPIVVEAALTQGRILMSRRDFKAAVGPLALAKAVALESRMFAPAVEAAARQIYAEGMLVANLERLDRDASFAMPLSLGLRGDRFARPLLLNNIGTVYMAAGRREDATRYFEEANAVLEGIDAPDLELTCIPKNLAMVTAEPARREALARGVWERVRDELGEHHLATLDALGSYALYVADPTKALALVTEVCRGYEAFHPDLHELRAYYGSALAFLAADVGARDRAIAAHAAVLASTAGSTDQDMLSWRHLAAGELALLRGEAARAIDPFTRVVEDLGKSPHWWDRLEAVHARVGLGIAAHVLGRDRDAVHQLDLALEQYPPLIAMNEEVEGHRRLALARRTLAAILRRLGKDPARALALEQQAMDFYRRASPTAYRSLLERGQP